MYVYLILNFFEGGFVRVDGQKKIKAMPETGVCAPYELSIGIIINGIIIYLHLCYQNK